MSRDFLLVLGGGVVSLITTFIVLFVMDWVYRRDAQRVGSGASQHPVPQPAPAQPKSAPVTNSPKIVAPPPRAADNASSKSRTEPIKPAIVEPTPVKPVAQVEPTPPRVMDTPATPARVEPAPAPIATPISNIPQEPPPPETMLK